jgi:hypothetical protein
MDGNYSKVLPTYQTTNNFINVVFVKLETGLPPLARSVSLTNQSHHTFYRMDKNHIVKATGSTKALGSTKQGD